MSFFSKLGDIATKIGGAAANPIGTMAGTALGGLFGGGGGGGSGGQQPQVMDRWGGMKQDMAFGANANIFNRMNPGVMEAYFMSRPDYANQFRNKFGGMPMLAGSSDPAQSQLAQDALNKFSQNWGSAGQSFGFPSNGDYAGDAYKGMFY
jgi:hypothetical protein